jgi:hypothetical protein
MFDILVATWFQTYKIFHRFLKKNFYSDSSYSENIWWLCWRRGTAFPLCAITASVAAIHSLNGTDVKYPHYTLPQRIRKQRIVAVFRVLTQQETLVPSMVTCRSYEKSYFLNPFMQMFLSVSDPVVISCKSDLFISLFCCLVTVQFTKRSL